MISGRTPGRRARSAFLVAVDIKVPYKLSGQMLILISTVTFGELTGIIAAEAVGVFGVGLARIR